MQKLENQFTICQEGSILSKNLIRWRKLTRLQTTAKEVRKRSILKNGVKNWENRLEKIEMAQMSEQIKIAKNFYRKKVLLTLFAQWQKNVIEFKKIGHVIQKCDSFHEINLIGKTLTVWQTALDRRKYLRDLNNAAEDFQASNLRSQLCYFIWNISVKRERNRELIEKAEKFSQTKVYHLVLKNWRRNLKEKNAENRRLEKMRKYYRLKILIKV